MKRLGRAFARLRGDGGKDVPAAASSGVQSENVRTVAPPWRSSVSWDEFDLRVYPHRGPDCFQFYAEPGSPISVRVEASLPGPGLRVQVFGCEAERETLVRASSDERGAAEIFAVARAGGMHSVEVGLDPPKSERPQAFRLSIDVPRRRRPVDGARRRRAEFVDVPLGHPYREAIAVVAGADVMTGRGEWWEFAPDDPVTRVELAEMVRDSLGDEGLGAVPVLLATLAAQDRLKGVLQAVPRDREGRDSSAAAASAGPPAVSPRKHGPDAGIARAQAISMIVGALERYRPGVLSRPPRGFSCTMASSVHRFHARIAEYNGLVKGLVGFGPEWDPRLAVSRGEVAELLWATMQRSGTAAEESSQAPLAISSPKHTDDEVEPDLATLGVYTSEYLLGAQEEIDRLMAESGPAEGSPSRSEAPSPIVPVALGRADIRQNIEQTRDRLKAKTRYSVPPAPEDVLREGDTRSEETGTSSDR